MPKNKNISYSPEVVEHLLMEYETDSLNNSIGSYHRFSPIALRLFDKISEILSYCMFTMERACTEDEKYEVYRSLNKVLRFLSDMISKNVYALLKFKYSIENIRVILKDIFTKLKVYMNTFHELVSGFKSVDCVYSYSHEMVYSRIGHRIKILLNILQGDWTHISYWKPTKALYMQTVWMGLIVVTDKDVVITREQIVTIDLNDVHDNIYSGFKSSALGTKMEAQDKLDWSLKGPIERNYCPATYTIVNCKRIHLLLEVAKYFQSAVVSLEAIESSNLDYIFLMCNVLLTQAREFNEELKGREVCELFNRVYSVLDYILPSVIDCKGDEESIIQISKECTLILKLSSFFKDEFDYNKEVTYNDYVDILYKYLVLYIKTADISFPDWPFFFVKDLSSTAIHRASKPKHVTINYYTHWDAKFKKLVHLSSLNPEDSILCCSICHKALNFTKPRTISVLEKCEHVFCIKCLMETVNTSTDKPAFKSLRNSFKCPRYDCSADNGNFTSGEQFSDFLYDVCNFTVGLDESYKAESVSGNENVFEEGIQFKVFDEEGLPKIFVTLPTHRNREPEHDDSNEGISSLPDDEETEPEVTIEAIASIDDE